MGAVTARKVFHSFGRAFAAFTDDISCTKPFGERDAVGMPTQNNYLLGT